jgi:hypothetical protein
MNQQGFYKIDGSLLYGPNFVLNANYELRKESKDSHSYPVDGWYWFEDENTARGFFGLKLLVLDSEGNYVEEA